MDNITQNMRQAAQQPFNTALAQAGLTPYNLNDDLAAVSSLVSYWSGQYQEDLTSGISANIQESASMLAQYQAQAVEIVKQLQEQPLQAQYALAQLTDSMDDDTAALQSLLSLHQAWLDQAKAIGDFGGIIEQAGTVKQLQDQLKNIQDTIAQQVGNFNAARLDLYRTMGSNYAPVPGQQMINIDLSPRFESQPEDPHAWANALAYELRAAL
jgi:hypothetical protein